ncbi:DNA repair protein RecO [Patescibacteria group bacterium]|nr:DNA repair protein RecO [Patescibacteria group bacterium]
MNKLPIYKTEGIILKSADLGQLDRLLTIYTAGYGKILARAISVRKKESKLRGYLEPFTHAKFLLAKSRTIDIVTDVEAIDSFSYLHKNLESLAYAYYFSELVDKLVVAPERDIKIWALLKRAMGVLNERRTDLRKVRTAFEEKLLEFLGHGIPKNKTALEIIQGLAEEEIISEKFLKAL